MIDVVEYFDVDDVGVWSNFVMIFVFGDVVICCDFSDVGVVFVVVVGGVWVV